MDYGGIISFYRKLYLVYSQDAKQPEYHTNEYYNYIIKIYRLPVEQNANERNNQYQQVKKRQP
jgi:hypothetical protein